MSEDELQRIPPAVDKGRRWTIGSVPVLYLEDIEAIYDVMRDFASNHVSDFERGLEEHSKLIERVEEVAGIERSTDAPRPPESFISMETDEFVLEKMAQLRSYKRSFIPKLIIHARITDLYLSCDRASIWLSIKDNDPPSIQAFEQIKRIVLSRRSRLMGLLQSVWTVSIMALALPIASFLIGRYTDYIWSASGIIAGWSTPILLIFWERFGWGRRQGIVIPRYKMDAPSVWERNRDGIVTGGVVALLILLITALARRLF